MSKNLIIFNTYHFQMSSIPDYEFEKTLEWESLDLENLEQAFNNMKNNNIITYADTQAITETILNKKEELINSDRCDQTKINHIDYLLSEVEATRIFLSIKLGLDDTENDPEKLLAKSYQEMMSESSGKSDDNKHPDDNKLHDDNPITNLLLKK